MGQDFFAWAPSAAVRRGSGVPRGLKAQGSEKNVLPLLLAPDRLRVPLHFVGWQVEIGERAAGWTLLFDGKTTNGWRGFKRDHFPVDGWAVVDGTLARVASQTPLTEGGDIITDGEYENFELRLEWKISPGGNSGVKYLISEDAVPRGHTGLGFEMQVLDDLRHPDAKLGRNGDRTTGSLYDLIPPSEHRAHAVGDWNQARIIVRGTHIEHWLNGAKVVEFERGSPAFKALIAESKFKVNPGFGDVSRGHILLQDHGNQLWYRSIAIHEL
jgi:hypothetical protein